MRNLFQYVRTPLVLCHGPQVDPVHASVPVTFESVATPNGGGSHPPPASSRSVFDGSSFLRASLADCGAVRPPNNELTFYARIFIPEPEGSGTVFFSDFLAFAIDEYGLAFCVLGEAINSGTVFRDIPLGLLEKNRWSDLVLRLRGGLLEFFQNGYRQIALPIQGVVKNAFDGPLNIGAFTWKGAERFFHGEIDAVALWHEGLPDEEIAQLSGVPSLADGGLPAKTLGIIESYNRCFYATIEKNVDGCKKENNRIWTLMRDDPHRPSYHLTAPVGWLFDPAGAFYLDGKYHVFSYHNLYNLLKYNSLDHYVSEDLVHWDRYPLAPIADQPFDVLGIWLNNQFIGKDGTLNILYTAHGQVDGKYVENGVLAQSCDGMVSFENKQVVFKNHHDGHTWLDGDTYYTITMDQKRGSKEGEFGDGILLYKSDDAVNWVKLGVFFRRKKNKHPDACELDAEGFAEYPYVVSLKDKDVLIVGGLPVHYWTGRLDKDAPAFRMETPEPKLLDYTSVFHCFNPSIVDHKGANGTPRRVILAMMEAAFGRMNDMPWYGAHALPRALELEGDHLCQYPVEELKTLRAEHFSLSDIDLCGSLDVPKEGDALEIIAEFDCGDAKEVGLKVLMSADSGSFIRVYYNAERNEFGADGNFYKTFRAFPGHAVDFGRGPAYASPGERIQIRIFVDKCLAEAFLNGQSCSMVAKDLAAAGTKIGLFSSGGTAVCKELHIWNMKAIHS